MELITAEDEARFDRWQEHYFATTHRDTPCGRNFATWNHPNFSEGKRKIDQNFGKIFPGAPATAEWWDDLFCHSCGRRKTICEC